MSSEEFTVTPWNVEGAVDYDELVQKFGTEKISPELQTRIEKITGEVHPMLKLGYFFSHRDVDKILSEYEKGNKFYLYTGRGPYGQLHIGHLLPLIFITYLQEQVNVSVILQVIEHEEFLYC